MRPRQFFGLASAVCNAVTHSGPPQMFCNYKRSNLVARMKKQMQALSGKGTIA